MNELKSEIYESLRTDSDLAAKIMLEKSISFATVRRWSIDKDSKLNQLSILIIIANHLNYSNVEELFMIKKNQ